MMFSTKNSIFAFPGGTAQPGQYSFPFVFQLPHTLPSSFVYFGEHKSKIAVTYKVKATMEENCDSSKSTFKPLISKQKFLV